MVHVAAALERILRRLRTRGRHGLALALGFGLVLLGMTGCSSPAPPPAPDPTCSLPDPRPALVPGSLVLPAQPAVLILGDSYTQGTGADPQTKGWAYLVGKPLGWRVTVNGIGGTGYVNPGPPGGGTYLQRLPTLQGRSFDLVVLQGGSNDHDATYPALQQAVSQTVDAVRTEFGGAAVVIVGPATPYRRPDAVRVLMQCVLAGYAVQQQLSFIDPMSEDWFADGYGDAYANPEIGHPNNAGYRRMADRFEADVRVLLGKKKPSSRGLASGRSERDVLVRVRRGCAAGPSAAVRHAHTPGGAVAPRPRGARPAG